MATLEELREVTALCGAQREITQEPAGTCPVHGSELTARRFHGLDGWWENLVCADHEAAGCSYHPGAQAEAIEPPQPVKTTPGRPGAGGSF